MSTSAKTSIGTLLGEYKLMFPVEWSRFLDAMTQNRKDAIDLYGEVENSDLVERKLFEMPETLYTIFDMRLPKDEFQWFRSKEGAKWFAKTYPMFRSSEKI